jgi:hypothetical protein
MICTFAHGLLDQHNCVGLSRDFAQGALWTGVSSGSTEWILENPGKADKFNDYNVGACGTSLVPGHRQRLVMKSLCVIAVVGLLAIGCGGSDDTENVEQSQGNATAGASKDKKAAPSTPPSEELEASPSADQGAYAQPSTPSKPSRSVSCTNRDGDFTSLTHFTFESDSGLVTALSVMMNNPVHGNKNGIAVSVRGPNDIDYVPAFAMHGGLPDGETAAVPFPSDFKVIPGGSIKVETTFDDGWNGDTSGECRIQL